jgi:hypothetical protein
VDAETGMTRRRRAPRPRIPGQVTFRDRLVVFAFAAFVLAAIVGGAFGVGYLIGKLLV